MVCRRTVCYYMDYVAKIFCKEFSQSNSRGKFLYSFFWPEINLFAKKIWDFFFKYNQPTNEDRMLIDFSGSLVWQNIATQQESLN